MMESFPMLFYFYSDYKTTCMSVLPCRLMIRNPPAVVNVLCFLFPHLHRYSTMPKEFLSISVCDLLAIQAIDRTNMYVPVCGATKRWFVMSQCGPLSNTTVSKATGAPEIIGYLQ